MSRKLQLELLPSAAGPETLRVEGILFHSRHDPVREARRAAVGAAGSALVVVLSPGLGYLVDHLGEAPIMLVERHPAIAALRPDSRQLVAPTPVELVRRLEERSDWRTGRLTVLTGVHLDEDRAYYESLRAAIEELLDKTAEAESTVRAFRDLWEFNLSSNAALIRLAGRDPGIHWLGALAERFSGSTVVLLAAGPSLEEDLPTLTATPPSPGERRLLVAVDSALPLVLAAGLRPDLCVTIDPQPVKARSLLGLGDMSLIGSVLSPPAILQSARNLYLFAQGHPSERRLPIPRTAVIEELGGSVATAAATIAIRLGARRLALVGQDLAILERRFHARGTHHEAARLTGLSRFDSVEARLTRAHASRALRRVPAVGGGTVPTTPAMDSYRRYFGELARRHPEVEMIQTSPRGAQIECRHLRLAELLEAWRKKADRGT